MGTLAAERSGEAPADGAWRRLFEPAFLLVVLELAAVLALIHGFRIEEGRGLLELTPLVLGGFVGHALLPRAWRLQAFLALSLVGFGIVFEPPQAAALVAIGLALIGIVHLPIAWSLRFGLLIACGVVLTGMRSHWIDAPWAAPILPVMGSIFMFRMVLYCYDLRTEKKLPNLWERLSYFFLLPNALFPLFPIIDFKAFRRGWYGRDELEIYRKGVRWMARGVVHLLIYRLVYMNWTPPVDQIADLGGVVQSMVTSYALYLRVSGIFHLIIGMLGLFGFDLPETHHHYFLATGFNDLWRRINIYWKDFMMKIVYYPIFVRLRRRDPGRAMLVATVTVFMISWWLHSYQMFWIRGSFPLTVVDAIFWTIFAVAVYVNSLLQSRYGAGKSLKARRKGVREATVVALKTVAMFAFMCAFWSFWTGHSLDGFAALAGHAFSGPAVQWAWLGLGVLALVALGVAHQVWVEPRLATLAARAGDRGATLGQFALLGVLGLASAPSMVGLEDQALLASIQSEQLNDHDQGMLLRGYYEELLEGEAGERGLGGLWDIGAEKPAHWVRLTQTDALRPAAQKLLERELKPDLDMEYCEARLRTNKHGMRDRFYPRNKPAGAYRFALMGASIEMGSGVENGQIFEHLAEVALNAANQGLSYERYEILNFAINGLSALAQLPLLQTKVRSFEPDTLLYFAHTIDARVLLPHIDRIVEYGVEVPYQRLQHIIDNGGLEVRGHGDGADDPMGLAGGDDEPDADVWEYQKSLLFFCYSKVVEICDELGIRPVWVYLQHPPNQSPGMLNRGKELLDLATLAGFHTIVLDGSRIYPQDDWRRLTLRPWDNHPNPEGHQRIADELFRKLLLNEDALELGLTRPLGAPRGPDGAAAGTDSPEAPEDG